MHKESLKKIIGNNIREQRELRMMSMEELSELLGLSPGFVGLIERGQRGATPINLYKLSKIFNVSLDSLFSDNEGKSPRSNKVKELSIEDTRRSKINSLIHDLDAKELDFIIIMVKSIKSFRDGDDDNLDKSMKEDYNTTFRDEGDSQIQGSVGY